MFFGMSTKVFMVQVLTVEELLQLISKLVKLLSSAHYLKFCFISREEKTEGAMIRQASSIMAVMVVGHNSLLYG